MPSEKWNGCSFRHKLSHFVTTCSWPSIKKLILQKFINVINWLFKCCLLSQSGHKHCARGRILFSKFLYPVVGGGRWLRTQEQIQKTKQTFIIGNFRNPHSWKLCYKHQQKSLSTFVSTCFHHKNTLIGIPTGPEPACQLTSVFYCRDELINCFPHGGCAGNLHEEKKRYSHLGGAVSVLGPALWPSHSPDFCFLQII